MKKIAFIGLAVIISVQLSKAQGDVKGFVKDASGNPLHFVFIKDQYNKAAFTDSLGNFSLAVHPDSRLTFVLGGYKDTSLFTGKNTDIQVTMMANGSNKGQSTLGVQQDEHTYQNSTIGTGGYLAPSHETGATRGSQYLFPTFVRGYVISSSNILVHDPGYLFDYDKIGGGLLLTTDNKTAVTFNSDQIKSFTLFGNDDHLETFERVPALDNAHWVQVFATGSKYAIYKVIQTKFIKATFQNNGLTQTGNDYDEYEDNFTYYVYNVQSGQMQKLSLKKKSIKEDFAGDADKVNKFITEHS
jgi:hypothetical protein